VYLNNYYKTLSFTLGVIAFIYSGVTGYMQFIPHARVPVLQYVSNRFGVSCDISINNFAGRIKSKIFYLLNTLDERFGDMVTVPHDLANQQAGEFDVGTLCVAAKPRMMVVSFRLRSPKYF